MANQEHVLILKAGVHIWNKWREKYPVAKPDLQGADLTKDNLFGGSFQNTDLRGANLDGTSFANANLHGANLEGTNLEKTLLHGVNFSESNLAGVSFLGVELHGSNLRVRERITPCFQLGLIS